MNTTSIEVDRPAPERAGAAVLHHIGFVLACIEKDAAGAARSLGARWDGKVFADPLQRVRVTFLITRDGSRIELVEPQGEKSPVWNFLINGGGLHHICYEVDSLPEQLRVARGEGAAVVRPPMPAVAFDGRRIAWVFTRYKLLIEYLERQPNSPCP